MEKPGTVKLSTYLLVLLILLVSYLTSSAQQVSPAKQKVKVMVSKVENGKTTDQQEEVTVQANSKVSSILERFGIIRELGQLTEDEVLNIRITRMRGDIRTKYISIIMDPVGGVILPPMPEAKEQQESAFLGIYVEPITTLLYEDLGLSHDNGGYVSGVIPNTPAEKAGIMEGDIIIGIDNRQVSLDQTVTQIKDFYRPGDSASIHYFRGGMYGNCRVMLGVPGGEEEEKPTVAVFGARGTKKRNKKPLKDQVLEEYIAETSPEQIEEPKPDFSHIPAPEVSFYWGTQHQEIPASSSFQGVMVTKVEKGSSAEALELQPGDIITDINRKSVTTASEMMKALEPVKKEDALIVAFIHEGRSYERFTMAKELPEGYIAPAATGDKVVDYEISMDKLHPSAFNTEGQREGQMINGNTALEDVRFFPNPTKGSFTLEFMLTPKAPVVTMIKDAVGQQVFYERKIRFEGGKYNTIVNLEGYPQGVYILNVWQNGKEFTEKILLQ